jgi:hypothetical protein
MQSNQIEFKMHLKLIYKAQNKKQKGLIMQGILAHSSFKKSKEWLRKYLTGLYLFNETVEKIGLEIVTKIGVPTPSLLPFRFDEKEAELIDESIVSKPSIHPLYHRFLDENKALFIKGYDSFSISETGLLWMKFGRNCTKDLHKINPFELITYLSESLKTEQIDKENEELRAIYETSLTNEIYTEYLIAWEQFSLKSRYVYALNPFRAICFTIKNI